MRQVFRNQIDFNFLESKVQDYSFERNILGKTIDKLLHGLFPTPFSNLLVVIARKK